MAECPECKVDSEHKTHWRVRVKGDPRESKAIVYAQHQRKYPGDVYDIPGEPAHEHDVMSRGGKVLYKIGMPKAFSPNKMERVDVSVPERLTPQLPVGKREGALI